jgi:peptide-methionine (S)-S-oxide reductase
MKKIILIIAVFTTQLALAEKAVFGGGCFWCMEPPYEKLEGVSAVVSGYSGGEAATAKYDQVSAGGTGHIEVIEVTYDPAKVSYEKLLDVYFKNIDPFDAIGQFCDKGDSYVAVIFTNNDTEKKLAEEKLKKVQEAKKSFGKVTTKITPLKKFYPAEEYHQDYYKKNPIRYKYYRSRCGRDNRLEAIGL